MVKLNTGFKLAALLQLVQTEMRMNDKAWVIAIAKASALATNDEECWNIMPIPYAQSDHKNCLTIRSKVCPTQL